MGNVAAPKPVLFLIAAFSRHDAALDWARKEAESEWGSIALESPRFEFTETAYYAPSMGADLKKTFFAFSDLRSPEVLPAAKLRSNEIEQAYADTGQCGETRPLNLDPGYLTESKLILASTKDHAHRIYLNQGIYAEITLRYRRSKWQAWEWTYPDYRRADFHEFFVLCRNYLRQQSSQI